MQKTDTVTEYRLNPATVSLYSEKLMLKTLLQYGTLPKLFGDRGWDDDVALPLGLPESLEYEDNAKQTVRALLKARWNEICNLTSDTSEYFFQAERNIVFLSDTLGLDAVEIALLRLAIYLRGERTLYETLRMFGHMDFQRCYRRIAELLDLPANAVLRAMKPNAKLYAYGFLERMGGSYGDIEDYLRWGDAINFDQMVCDIISEQDWLDRCITPATNPKLQWEDFLHIPYMRDNALAYLHYACDKKLSGVNILLYGKPGTGKTEFASLLAKRANMHACTLLSQDKDGDYLGGRERLFRLRIAQTLIPHPNTLLIFDEIEDIFSGSNSYRSIAAEHKAWINNFLENNSVPTIWISNDVSCMDRAAIRRFDLVIEMPDLPRDKKARLLETASAGLLSADYIQHFSRQPQLLPAVIERGLKVASIVCDDNSDFGEQTLHIFNQTLQAQRHKTIGKLPAAKAAYSLQWVNCDSDLAAISAGLIARPQGRICCYGAPGTGKSAWAQWIAEQAGLPVSLCKGSDLLDKYVGGTEENIAAAFRRADTLGEALIIDEADSFLFARQGAERSWERSMVNEMLTQIEQFDGLLVITTNLMDELDPAVLRRFDLKLKFDWLTAGQAAALAAEHLSLLHLPPLDAAQQTRLQQLTSLAPGDFAAIARRHRFAPFVNAAEWLQTLMEECQLKAPHLQKRRIGF